MINRDKFARFDPAISLIRVLAMFLIIQSHADILFPPKIAFLATGGALGNELFFLVGGYLYSTKNDIWPTTGKRFIRLYLPTYLMTVALFVFGVVPLSEMTDPKQVVYRLIWPTSFWFVSAIFVDGFLLHLIVKIKVFENRIKTLVCLAAFLILNIVIYYVAVEPKNQWIIEDYKMFGGMFYYKCLYSFLVFCIGYWLKLKKTEIRRIFSDKVLFVLAVTLFVSFYGFKFALNKEVVDMRLQIISQPITVLCVMAVFLWVSNSELLKKWLESHNTAAFVINELGTITLESFLVQFELIYHIGSIGLMFPANYLLTIAAILVASFCFRFLNDYLYNKLTS